MKVNVSTQPEFVELDSILPGETFLFSDSFHIRVNNNSTHLVEKAGKEHRVPIVNLDTGGLIMPSKSARVKRIPLKVVLDD